MNRTGYQYIFRIVMIGDNYVGKSCLVRRYTEGLYPKHILATIGLIVCEHILEVEPGVRVKLEIIDTPGLNVSWSNTKRMIPFSNGCLLVFDLNKSNSFSYIKHLHKEVCKIKKSQSHLFVLVGHKCDIKEQDVRQYDLEYFESELGVPYIEASAKTGHNVTEAFELLTRRIYQGYLSGEVCLHPGQDKSSKNKTNNDKPAEINKCCAS